MIITCIGHAMFLLELSNGMRIVTDPVDTSSGYPVQPVACDAVLVSHGHHDHCAMEAVRGASSVIDTAGEYTLSPDVSVSAVQAFHDDVRGAKRGKTLLFIIEAEGLRVAHLGDLGHIPEKDQLDALKNIDVLLTPVGGVYTINAEQAKATADLVKPSVILPMHYRTDKNADWPISPVTDFTILFSKEDVREQKLIRITAGDLMCQPKVCVLEAQLKG